MPVISSLRVTASANLSNYSNTTAGTIGKNEIDNHADTICAGPNWKLLELSGEYCNVSPFSAEYQPKQNVPIAKCAMTYTCLITGNSVVLVADQVLWFGNELHFSVINPRPNHGYCVCDDPCDPHCSLGIDLESVFIPLLTSGPNLVFESRVPTDWELSNLPIIQLTTPIWNPAGPTPQHSCVLSHPPLTVVLSPLSTLMPSSCTMHLRGHMI